jgi:hypothetical protein
LEKIKFLRKETELMAPSATLGSQAESFGVSSADEDLIEIKNSQGRHGQYLYDITQFYKKWHIESDDLHGTLVIWSMLIWGYLDCIDALDVWVEPSV